MQAAPGAEEKRFDRGAGCSQRGRDLVVAKAVNVAEHDRFALLLGQHGELRVERRRFLTPDRGVLDARRDLSRIVVDDRQRLAHPGRRTAPAGVTGDRAQPCRRVAHLGPGEQVAVRREKHLLRRVLGLVRVAEEHPADAVDHAGVLGVQPTQLRAGRPGEGRRGSAEIGSTLIER